MNNSINGLLVAPTEPKQLRALGKVSSVPERFGCDFLWSVKGGLAGVQRKEFRDLLASISDGRLNKEVGQMNRVVRPVLVVEGCGHWTLDGELNDQYSRITRGQLRALLYSIRDRGIWVEASDGLADTEDVVAGIVRWTRKEVHRSLAARPKPQGRWGRVDHHGWAVHVMTSFPGIGPGTAESLIQHFGGVPLAWMVDERELAQVPGIGPVRARRLIRALERVDGLVEVS